MGNERSTVGRRIMVTNNLQDTTVFDKGRDIHCTLQPHLLYIHYSVVIQANPITDVKLNITRHINVIIWIFKATLPTHRNQLLLYRTHL